jgi:hypothetical protein
MLQPIGKFFKNRAAVALDEVDRRHFIERYLRDKIGTSALFCDRASQGRIIVRAASPPVRQEVYLLEYDLAKELKREVSFDLKELTVTQL